MLTMADLLETHCELPEEKEEASSWQIIAQVSSISLGTNSQWLLGDFLNALSKNKTSTTTSTTLRVVFPSKDNVISSYYKDDRAGCLFYTEEVHNKQKWLENHLW